MEKLRYHHNSIVCIYLHICNHNCLTLNTVAHASNHPSNANLDDAVRMTDRGIALACQQRNQIFLGMIAVQEQPSLAIKQLITDCDTSGKSVV